MMRIYVSRSGVGFCVIAGLALLLGGCVTGHDKVMQLRFNEVQFIGSHNSYKKAIDPELLQQLGESNPELAAALDYAHLSLVEQLDLGLRKLELDIFHDPDGGLYSTPAGLTMIEKPAPYDAEDMRRPGFKVLHVQDLDFRSHCQLLAECLNQLADWSQSHPRHSPIVITVNAKDEKIDRPGFVQPLPFDAEAWSLLDEAFRAGLDNRLFTPDGLRGDATSLAQAIKSGWPLIESMLGKFIVVLDHGGAKLESYVHGHPGLRQRAMFVNAAAGSPEAAVLIINDPVEQFAEIKAAVAAGYLVRTRSDADTREARQGSYARMQRAFASGAQIISTDYYLPERRFGHGFQVRFSDGTYFRCNPVLVDSCNHMTANEEQ